MMLVMVFSYLPYEWCARLKQETWEPIEGVYMQYVVWSGHGRFVVLQSDYDQAAHDAALKGIRDMRSKGVEVDRPRHLFPRMSLIVGAHRFKQIDKSHFRLPRFSSYTSSNGSDEQWTLSSSLFYPLIVTLSVSILLIWKSRKLIGPGRCGVCGYSLDGLTGDSCPECGTIITHD